MYCGHKPAWISKILDGERGMKLSDLDKVADFFGLTVSQLLQQGISPLTERRRHQRRGGSDRRTKDRRQQSIDPLPPRMPPFIRRHDGDGHDGDGTKKRDFPAHWTDGDGNNEDAL